MVSLLGLLSQERHQQFSYQRTQTRGQEAHEQNHSLAHAPARTFGGVELYRGELLFLIPLADFIGHPIGGVFNQELRFVIHRVGPK